MSIWTIITIGCDAPSCGATFPSVPGQWSGPLREAAADEGWTRGPAPTNEDYCPVHGPRE